MSLRILHVSFSDIEGGAARAAYRIHSALNRDASQYQDELQCISYMCVVKKISADSSVFAQRQSFRRKLLKAIQIRLSRLIRWLLRTRNSNLHSHALLPTGFASYMSSIISDLDIDIVNIHWLGDWSLTIEDIARIEKPIVWTLHDQWVFCGTEHYESDVFSSNNDRGRTSPRYVEGYYSKNRDEYDFGLDLCRYTWMRKLRSWARGFHLVAPSRWLLEAADKSYLCRDWPKSLIHHPIDLDFWKKEKTRVFSEYIDLDQLGDVILFGAIAGMNDYRKGADLALEAISIVNEQVSDMTFISFGAVPDLQSLKKADKASLVCLPEINDDRYLRYLYSNARAVVVPSRQEAFGQIAAEAQACGTPVIAFESTGISDIVQHLVTGYLACPFDVLDLASGIRWALDLEEDELLEVSTMARRYTLQNLDSKHISRQYISMYNEVADFHGLR